MEKPINQVDLSIIIVSYNTVELTVACITSIIETVKKISFEIIVIDNASRDNSIEKIKNLRIKNDNVSLKIAENKENLGFAKANNIGIGLSSGKYVLFLNSDTVVYKDTLDGMVEFMEKNKNVGAATCYVELPNGMLDDASHRGFPTPWRALSHFSTLSKFFPRSKFFSGYSLGWMDHRTTHAIEALAGAFMLVRRVAGDEVGWWDEDFFWYGEDLDFCYRLQKKGWNIFFVSEYKILHYKGVSGGIKQTSQHLTTATLETRKRATDARFHAMKIFYNKHYKDKYNPIIKWLVMRGIDVKKILAASSIK